MPVETRYEHIVLDSSNTPIIAGTTMKVRELVLAHIAHGWSPAELQFQFPYLTLGKIHSALAYYWDHREEMDRQIERGVQAVSELRQSLGETPLIERLKQKGYFDAVADTPAARIP